MRKVAKKILILMGTIILIMTKNIWAEEEAVKYDLGEVVVTATRTERNIALLPSGVSIDTE